MMLYQTPFLLAAIGVRDGESGNSPTDGICKKNYVSPDGSINCKRGYCITFYCGSGYSVN